MHAYTWLTLWHKTPLDLGLRPDELDPAYYDAMIAIEGGLRAEQALMNT